MFQCFIDVENPKVLIRYNGDHFIDDFPRLTIGGDRCVYLGEESKVLKLNATGRFELVRDLSLQAINACKLDVFDEDHLLLTSMGDESNGWLLPLDPTKPLHCLGPSKRSLSDGKFFPRKGGSFFEIQTSMGVYDIRENNTGELPKWCADLPEDKTPVEITVVEYKLKKELVEKPEEKMNLINKFNP